MESYGKYLREEREKRGITIEEISRITKISPGQLKSLEKDDFAALPPITFVKGFVRSYSKHIGIEADDAINRLEQYLSEIEQGEEDHSTEAAAMRKFRRVTPDPKMLIGAAVVFVVVVLIVTILAVRGCSSKEEARFRDAPSTSAKVSIASASYLGDPVEVPVPVGEQIKSPIPTVPPQAFQVRKTGPYKSPVNVPVQEVPSESPGGGAEASTP